MLLIKYFLINKFKNRNIKIILTIHSGLFNLSFKKYIAGLIFSLIYKKLIIYILDKFSKTMVVKFLSMDGY